MASSKIMVAGRNGSVRPELIEALAAAIGDGARSRNELVEALQREGYGLARSSVSLLIRFAVRSGRIRMQGATKGARYVAGTAKPLVRAEAKAAE